MSSLLDLVALSMTPFSWRRALGAQLRSGVPPTTLIRQLAAKSPDASSVLERLPGLARAALDRAERGGLAVIPWNDPNYPPSLAAIDDPPPVLWVRGHRDTLLRPSVALVGSRAGSPYAMAVAEQLACALVANGVVVVSGLARGVDSAAHRGALQAGGRTVAVLGSGVDVVYPPEHRSLADDIAGPAEGALVSELPPGTRPLQWFFPLRNRIISGLSRGVVVVEAGDKSGSLITARCALEQGREVLAVPGSVLGGRNRGGHALLKDGARMVESVDDILEELGVEPATGRTPARPSSSREGAVGDPILRSMTAGEPCDLDALAALTGLTSARLLPRLFELEMDGAVSRVGGGRFMKT